MKKHLPVVFACLFVLPIVSFAQVTKGSVLLGGGISVGTNKSESNNQEFKSSSVGINPAVGVAVKDNVVVGVRFGYFHSKNDQPNAPYPIKQTTEGFSAGVFYRRYLPLSQKFYLFGEGAAYYSHSTLKNQFDATSVNTQENNIAGVNFYPGITYAVSRKFHLEAGLNNLVDLAYTHNKYETKAQGNTTTNTGSGFSFSTNVSSSAPLTVGFRIVLGK